MRIVVCLKEVIDLAQVRFKTDGRTPVLDGLPVRLGAFEKNALEEAIRIKERLTEVEVIALSAGSGRLKESIKEALAMGADRAVLVLDPLLEIADSAGVARTLAAALERIGSWDVCLLGEGSDDEYTGQTPSRVAALLGKGGDVVVDGHGVEIDDAVDAVVVVLEPDPIAQRSEVVADVDVARRLQAGEHSLAIHHPPPGSASERRVASDLPPSGMPPWDCDPRAAH